MAHPATRRLQVGSFSGMSLLTAFDAGRLTSDGGLVWLAEADRAVGVCDALAACIPEWRRGPVVHSLATLARQRILQIACGYADQNDATTLRSDPLLKLVCGRLPEAGADLASQPTLSRLENAVDRHACEAMAEALVTLYLRERQRSGAPTQLVLDLDGTDDPLLGQALAMSAAQDGAKVRLASETTYHAQTWTQPRRVVYKAEALSKGPNTRFVVTTRTQDPLSVYDWYVDRGQPENWLKDLKNAVEADRLSDHRFWANAFRLLMHAAAYWLLDTLRRWLISTIGQAAQIQMDTLRLRLIKIGARLRQLPTRFQLHLPPSHQGEPLWHALAARRGYS